MLKNLLQKKKQSPKLLKLKIPGNDKEIIETLQDVRNVIQSLGTAISGLTNKLEQGIEASVSLKKLDYARALKDRIKKDATMA